MGKPTPFPLIMTHMVIRMKVQIAKVRAKMVSGRNVCIPSLISEWWSGGDECLKIVGLIALIDVIKAVITL